MADRPGQHATGPYAGQHRVRSPVTTRLAGTGLVADDLYLMAHHEVTGRALPGGHGGGHLAGLPRGRRPDARRRIRPHPDHGQRARPGRRRRPGPGTPPAKAPWASSPRSLAVELAGTGITVNALAPGPFRTPLNAGMDDNPQIRHFLAAEVPLGRWAEPAELTDAALLLTDPASSYLTGVILPVDGGWTTH